MEIRTLVGIRRVDMNTREGGHIVGYKFFVTYKEDYVEGVVTDSFFLSDDKLGNVQHFPSVGSELKVYYNRYGRVSTFEVV